MNVNKKVLEKINEFENSFDELITNDKLNIGSLETILLNNIEDYKQIMNHHAEELITNKINEKELIRKKNSNGDN